jgi:peptidoglycan/LPS O-acetylase OafA/YrhL
MLFQIIGQYDKKEEAPTTWAVLALNRFLLALIILNAHLGVIFQPSIPFDELPSWYKFGRDLGPLAAIVCFLTISGFSIAHSYKKPKGFYTRRLARIYPALLISACLFAASLQFGPIKTTSGITAYPPSVSDLIGLLMFMNGIIVGSFLGPAWSLAAEAIYYAITPILAKLSRVFIIFLISISSILFYFHDELKISPLPGALNGIAAASLFWAWGLGFLYYYTRGLLILALLTFISVLMLSHFNYEGGGLYYATILATSLSFFILRFKFTISKFLASAFNYLGDISYPLFILHYPIIYVMNGLFGIENALLIVSACFGASHITLVFLEKPIGGAILRLSNNKA